MNLNKVFICYLDHSIRRYLYLGCHNIFQSIKQLNMFKKPYNSQYGRRSEILNTRLYIILMSISLIVMTFYTSIAPRTQSGQIQNPSIDVYRQLVARYGDAVSCPCKQVGIPYDAFITTIPVCQIF